MPLVDQYRVAAATGKSLGAFCLTRGVDLNVIAPAMGVDPRCLQDTKAFISLNKFASLLENLAVITNDDLFGLKFGAFFNLGDSGPFGFGLLNAPRLENAVDYYGRFLTLTADYHHFSTEIDHAYTTMSWGYSPLIPSCAQYADLIATLTVRQFRKSCGERWQPTCVELVRSKPRSETLHRTMLSPVMRFAGRECRITFPNNDLLAESPSADSRVLEIMLERCEEGLEKKVRSRPLELRVREEILKRFRSGEFLLPQIASVLSMSGRNLQRQLEANGLGFEVVLEETRRELAELLLSTSDLTMSQIAERVGYSGVNAFSRAATNWFGSPPSIHRQKLLRY